MPTQAATRIEKITCEILPDDDPDLSYLDTDEMTEWTAKEIEQAQARLADYGNGWQMVGVRLRASLVVNGTHQTVTSPGLWGIESDSGAAYFEQVGDDEACELEGILSALGFHEAEIRDALANVESA